MQQNTVFAAIDDAGLGRMIARQFETFCRAQANGKAATHRPGHIRVQTGEMHPLANFVVVHDAGDMAALDEATAPLRREGAPSAVVIAESCPAPAAAALSGWGYALVEEMPAMGVALDRLGAAPVPEGCRFEEIGVARDEAWCDAFAAGYGVPRGMAGLFGPKAAASVGTSAIRHFAMSRDRRIVATSALFLEGGLAGIYAVATLETERGKGLGACATAMPLELARAAGYRTGVLQASTMGEPVYRRLGFERFGALQVFVRMPQS